MWPDHNFSLEVTSVNKGSRIKEMETKQKAYKITKARERSRTGRREGWWRGGKGKGRSLPGLGRLLVNY